MSPIKAIHLSCLLLVLIAVLGGCSALQPSLSGDLPQIISTDDLNRPFVKLGKIKVTREVYGILDYEIRPDILEWGQNAIRAEAEKMGADAVIEPEVTGSSSTYLIVPSTVYRATGIAIKFK